MTARLDTPDIAGRSARRAPAASGAATDWNLLLLQALFFVALVALWEVASRTLVSPQMAGRPSTIVSLFSSQLFTSRLWTDVQATATTMVLGLGFGVVTGTVLALVLGSIRRLGDAAEPYLVGLYATPNLALAPLFILWFGLGLWAKVVYVWLSTFFFIFIAVYDAVRHPPRPVVDAVLMMGASRFQLARKVLLPNSLAYLLGGLTLAVPYSLLSAVAAEMIVAREGVGHAIGTAMLSGDVNRVFTQLILVSILGALLGFLARALQKGTSQWRG